MASSVPSAAPRNLTFDLSEQQLSLNWAKLKDDELQGKLLAYKVQWTLGGEPQVSVSVLVCGLVCCFCVCVCVCVCV